MDQFTTGIILLFIGSIFFAYYRQVPIAFLFSGVVSLASGAFMFELDLSMFGIIMIMFGLWQFVEVVRHYGR